MKLNDNILTVLNRLEESQSKRILEDFNWQFCEIAESQSGIFILRTQAILKIETSDEKFLGLDKKGNQVDVMRRHHIYYPRTTIRTCLTAREGVKKFMELELQRSEGEYEIGELEPLDVVSKHLIENELVEETHQCLISVYCKNLPKEKEFKLENKPTKWHRIEKGQFYEVLPKIKMTVS